MIVYQDYECVECGHVAGFLATEVEDDEEWLECPVCGQITLTAMAGTDPDEAWGYDDELH